MLETLSRIKRSQTKPISILNGLLKTLVITSVCLSFSASLKAQLLEPYSAKYVALRNGSEIGFAELDLENLGDNNFKLRFYSDASLFLIYDKREEISFFRHEKEQLIPFKYSFNKKSTFKDQKLALEFDPEKELILMGEKETMPWLGEMDHQIYRLAAQKLLSEGKKDFEFDLINYRGQRKHYGFKVQGEEILDLPYGKLKAIKVKTIRQSKKRVTYTWFAPELNYLLVRIQQFKDGNEQGDILLSTFDTDPPKNTGSL